MSGIARWNLGIGALLLGVAVLCSVLELIPASVITGLLGLMGIGVAGYDVLFNWQTRSQLRRRAAKASRERERQSPSTVDGARDG